MTEKLGEHSDSLDHVIAKSITLDQSKTPDLKTLKSCILSSSARSHKVAKLWTIVDRHTGEIHHHGLTLETYDQTKKHGWRRKADKSVTLDDEDTDEIRKLFDFIGTMQYINSDGEYAILRQDDERIPRILQAISATGKRRELIDQILLWVEQEPTAIDGLVEFSAEHPERSKSLVAALNYGHYSRVLKQFEMLIQRNDPERIYQKFLEENYWIFGSEFCELINNRVLIANTQLDFPLRRTVDEYLEVIEIKRPFSEPLFVGADKRLAPRSELNEAIAQAEEYLDLFDRESDRIWRQYEIRADKVRAKIVIGRDGDKQQLDALRRNNSNRPRVEVITFDQLMKVGQRILRIFDTQTRMSNGNITVLTDEVPF